MPEEAAPSKTGVTKRSLERLVGKLTLENCSYRGKVGLGTLRLPCTCQAETGADEVVTRYGGGLLRGASGRGARGGEESSSSAREAGAVFLRPKMHLLRTNRSKRLDWAHRSHLSGSFHAMDTGGNSPQARESFCKP